MVDRKNPLSEPQDSARFWAQLGYPTSPSREPTADEISRFTAKAGIQDPLAVALFAHRALQQLGATSPTGLPGGGFFASLWTADPPPQDPEEETLPYDPVAALRFFDTVRSEKNRWVYEIGSDDGEKRRYVVTRAYDGLTATRKSADAGGETLEVSYISARDEERIRTLTRLIPNDGEMAEIARILEGLVYVPVTRSGESYVVTWPPLGTMEVVLSRRPGKNPLPVATISTWTDEARAFLLSPENAAAEAERVRQTWLDDLPRVPFDL